MNSERRKGRPPKKAQYPIFERLAAYTLDDYWKQLLLAAAHGKMPRFVSYRQDQLLYRRGRASSGTPCSEAHDTPADFTRIIAFFHSIGLSSMTDQAVAARNIEEQQKTYLTTTYDNWRDIKRVQVRDMLLKKYLVKLRGELRLTAHEEEYLRAQLAIAQLFGAINSDTVRLVDGEIESIAGLMVEGIVRGSRRVSFVQASMLAGVAPSALGSIMPSALGSTMASATSSVISEGGDRRAALATQWRSYCEEIGKLFDAAKFL